MNKKNRIFTILLCPVKKPNCIPEQQTSTARELEMIAELITAIDCQ